MCLAHDHIISKGILEIESIFREEHEQNEQQCSQGEYEMFDTNETKEDKKQFEIRDVGIQPQQVDELKIGLFYNNIDELFDSYLMYAERKGFNVAKKSSSKGTGGSFRKYQTIACGRKIKSTGNKYSKRIAF
ncbi:hypothetical protein M9H77_26426 [Catharanthus roseus]|uniref:Uncharacterized protein n=1 Tax=Catharanthus roseus TaxID=4058 RepID=A0ACC0ACB6_CATRO|nr:hypothetical protein M9H77_26426 [Catharanthus roseus]